MFAKIDLKEKAINLRKEGRSYTEILKETPVAKSTLSLWLRDVGLSRRQKQRITEKRLAGVRKGGLVKRNQRLSITEYIQTNAENEVGSISERELFLIGTALYWAEGSKQKPHNPSASVIFANSDPQMVLVFLRWLRLIGVPASQIVYSIYLHDTAKEKIDVVRKYWSMTLKVNIKVIDKIYYKKGKVKTLRKNRGEGYYGLVRVKVLKSTNLNRKINGWISGICKA